MLTRLPITRSLILLLILRVAAAPFSLPESPRVHARHHLPVRLCKCLPVRPLSSNLRPEASEGGYSGHDLQFRLTDLDARVVSLRAIQFALSRLSDLSSSLASVHLSDCARC